MTVTADDGNKNRDSEEVVITVTPAPSATVSVPKKLTFAESAGNVTFKVTASESFGKAVTFEVSYSGTARGAADVADGDYDNDAVTEVVFNAGDTEKEISVPINDDTLAEGEETIIVTLALAEGNSLPDGHTAGNLATTVNITDNDTLDKTWTLSLAPNEVTEGAGETEVTVTATRSGTATAVADTDIAISVAGVTATAGEDFAAVGNFTISVPAGESSATGTFDLTPTDDALDEADETLVVSGTLADNSVAPATLTITDNDDAPALSIAAPAAVVEGDSGESDMDFTVTLSAASGRQVTVKYALGGGTATSGTDHAAFAGGALTFAAGDTEKTLTVKVTGDEVDEEDETVVMVLSEPVNATIAKSTVTATITDDDSSPVVAPLLAPAGKKVGETVEITAQATDDDGDTVGWTWTRVSGPALPQGAVVNRAKFSMVPTEAGAYALRVTADDDNGNTDSEDVTVTVGAAAAIVLTIADVTAVEGETFSFTVTATPAPSSPISFGYRVTAESTDSATEGADFTAVKTAQTATIAANATSTTITVEVTDDRVDEEDETFTVTLSDASSGVTISDATAIGTITDNDASPALAEIADVTLRPGQAVDITAVATDADNDPITYVWTRKDGETEPALPQGTNLGQAQLAFTPPAVGVYTMTVTADDGNGNTDSAEVTITVSETATVSVPATLEVTEGTDSNATVTITTEAAFGEEVTFNVSYADVSATGASDPANGDYDNDAVTAVTFGAADTEKNIVIPLGDDDSDESDETFTVTIAPASTLPGGFTLANAVTMVTISDDDASLALAEIADVTLRPGQAVDITAVATDADNDPITYVWTRKDGETEPVLPDDTALNQATLSFVPTQAGVYTMTVTASDGNGNTDSEEVTITVSAAATVSVPAALEVTEGTDSNVIVTVTAGAAFGEEVVFNVSYGGTASGAGDAANGDYGNAVTAVVFGAGDLTKDIIIPLGDDALDEEDETIVVTIAPAAALPGGFALANAVTTVTIVDDDIPAAPPGVTVSVSALSIEEGSSGRYTVVLDSEPDGVVAVTVSGASGDITVSPSSLTFTAQDWESEQGITVSAAQDADAVVDEVVILTHSASGAGYDGLEIASVSVSVIEDDTAAVRVTPTALALDEGEAGSYTVVLESEPVDTVTVAVVVDTDAVTVLPALLSFTAQSWSDEQTVVVTAVRDADTQDASALIRHRVSGGDYDGVVADSVTVVVTDTTLVEQAERANRINRMILPQVAGIAVSETLGVVADRIGAVSSGSPTGSLRFGVSSSGEREPLYFASRTDADSEPSLSEVLDGTSFTLVPGVSELSGGASPALWGRVRRSSFSGSEEGISWDGEVWSGHLGTDIQVHSEVLAGIALSYSEGDVDAVSEDEWGRIESDYRTKLLSAHPYLAWITEEAKVWGSLGYGEGELRIEEELGLARRETDMDYVSIALGGEKVLYRAQDWIVGGTTRISVKGEGSWSRVETAGDERMALEKLGVDVQRARILLEGSHERESESGWRFTPALEMGLRYDGGDIVSGLGVESGLRLNYRQAERGLTAEVRARGLVAHEKDRKEWGLGALVRVDAGSDGRGAFLTFEPSRGVTDSGMGQLFARNTGSSGATSAGDTKLRLKAEAGYGFGVGRDGPMGVLSPYAGVTLEEAGERKWRVGTRYEVKEALSLSLELEQKQALDTHKNSLLLKGTLRW